MNVNEKGAIGLIEVVRDLAKKGFECFTPIHDYSGIDLIALDKNKVPIRLQVKYRTAETRKGVSTDTINVGFCSVVNGKKVPIDTSYIDGWAIYCPEVDKIVYVKKDNINDQLKGIAFRLTEGSSTVNENKTARKLYSEFKDITEW